MIESYINLSKQELVEKLRELEAQNKQLSEQIQNIQAKEATQHRFKEKYAIDILDALPDMLTVFSHSGVLVDLASSEETNHVGQGGEQLIGMHMSKIVPPEAYRNIKENLDKVVETGKCSTAHHDLIVDGELHHYENRIFPLDNEYVLIMCRDITETVKAQEALDEATLKLSKDVEVRKKQEKQIKELNYIMDAILNNIPVYLFMKDPGSDFRYLYWNKEFARVSGIAAADVLGKTDFEVFPNIEDAKKFRKDDLDLLEHGENIEFEELYTTVTGEERIVKTLKSLVPSENKLPLIIGISWDITEIKETEKELIAAKIKAEQSDKLKSAFLANMSHEIRTPLNAIVGFAKLLNDSESDEERQQYSEIIDNNAGLLLQLINDILDLSKIEAGTLEFINRPTKLDELCKCIYETQYDKTQRGVSLIFEDNHEDIELVIDPNRLSQVITNLITNAIKFTYEGDIRFGFHTKGDAIEFYVKDTGIGIPYDRAEQIFSRFVKLNSFAQGTGLGLSICKMIVEKVGGNIWVESEEQQGSIFHFTIPYQKPKPKEKPEEKEKNNHNKPLKVMTDKKSILIAEDIDSNYLLLKAVLGKKYDLQRACNGKEAVELFQSTDSGFDLILMDIKMPEMDGLEATGIIKQLSPEIPIVALTAFAFDSDREKALEAGCDDCLTKPISIKELACIMSKYQMD